MEQNLDFLEFPKMARLSREMIITEKIDGTNSQIFIWDEEKDIKIEDGTVQKKGKKPDNIPFIYSDGNLHIATGSRTRWITPKDDNYGFSKWVFENSGKLIELNDGRHFGEWWGSGVQRGYGLQKGDKRFSLFNVSRWALHGTQPRLIPNADPTIEKFQDVLPEICSLVPELYRGQFDTQKINEVLEDLKINGSYASKGFMKPEGIIAFHVAANIGFKKTIEKDEIPKSLVR